MPQHKGKELPEQPVYLTIVQILARLFRFHFQRMIRVNRDMRQRQHPTQQQGYRQHDKQIPHVLSRRVRGNKNREESQYGNQRGPQQRHGRLLRYIRQRRRTLHAPFQIYQYPVDNHDRVVHQHSHGNNQRSQRNPLQRPVKKIKHHERPQHDNHQSRTDNHPAPEPHGKHQHQNHDYHRFHQINHENINGIPHPVRLKKYFLKIHAHWNPGLFQLQ